MYPPENMTAIGNLGKTFGVHGGLKVDFLPLGHDLLALGRLRFLFVFLKGDFVPFELSTIDQKRESDTILHFTDITNPEEAKNLSGLELFLPYHDIPPSLRNTQRLENIHDDLLQYKVAIEGEIYSVTGYQELPEQLLLEVTLDTGSIAYIPLVDEFITEVKENTIYLELPDGLLDLNT